jgi:hypothetical protein
MSAFSFFKPSNGLWKDAKISKVHARVLERITDLPKEVRENRHNMEFLSLVANLVENAGINNKEKTKKQQIDKKLLVIMIFNSLYGNLGPADVDLLNKNIEFLHDNNHIVKEPTWKMCLYCVGGWIKRKVL